MKKILVTLSLSLILTGCSSINRNVSNLVFPPHPNSDQRKGENVHLKLNYKEKPTKKAIRETCKKPPKDTKTLNEAWMRTKSVGFMGGISTTSALQFATEQVQQFLQKEAERYTGSYAAVAAGDHFYTSCDRSVNEIHLEGLTLSRSVKNVGKVMELSFDIEQTIDGTAFQIKPKEISIEQSKAKVTAFDITRPFGFDILAPWTVFKVNSLDELSPLRPNKVDVTAEVSITGVWLDATGAGHSELIATRKFKFNNVLLGEKRNLEKEQVASQLFPAIPRSHIDGDRAGAGNFIVSVLVTEYDDYAERVMELEQGVEKNKDSLIQRLTDAI